MGIMLDDMNLGGGGSKLNFIPDYSQAYTISSGFVCPEPGWIVGYGVNGTGSIKINNVNVAQGNWYTDSWSGNTNCQIIADTGDVVTWSYSGASPSVKFIPMKY